MDIIKGSDLMLFVKGTSGYKSLAFATSHSFNISSETADISTKDHGFWGAKEVTRITWSITTDNLYTVSTFNDLYDRMISRQPIEVYFGLKTPAERAGTPPTVNLPGDTANTWHPSSQSDEPVYYGRVYITSLDCTAAAGDNATFSATLDGIGSITKGTPGSVESMAANGGSSSTVTQSTVTGTVTSVNYNKVDTAQDAYDGEEDYYMYNAATGKFYQVTVSENDYESGDLVLYTKGSTSTESVEDAKYDADNA